MNKTILFSNHRKLYMVICLLVFLFNKPVKAGVYYWVGGTGNWSQYNTHWSTSSGGSIFHLQTPTPTDTVIFDANSFLTVGDTVFVDSTIITCKDMVWTNVTHNPVFVNKYYSSNSSFSIYGSLTLSSNMTWSYGGEMYFEATSGVNTITSASQALGSL
ncbi:MAG: hypothetical protein ACXVOH_07840, partial [Bacteroidia bacterium]